MRGVILMLEAPGNLSLHNADLIENHAHSLCVGSI